ncbi:transcriptional regulator ATRX homolog [Battus philenor]|uniref:transcriptional regulator ATRX homolog n=1 Tax=Battus philenor TaxID=42288 RepID=UPI0035CFD96E
MANYFGLIMLWVVFIGVHSNEEKTENGFVQPLDFGPIFNPDDAGIASLASNPVAAAILKADKSQYSHLFDSVVSSSIDSLHSRLAPKENVFSASNFGFNPIASQNFYPPAQSAKLKSQSPRPSSQLKPTEEQLGHLRYDIRTIHDANYKVYKPEENHQRENILEALKKDPTVAAYFQPAVTNVEVAHPLNYRKEELIQTPEVEQNYKPYPYIAEPTRIRRYAGGRKTENLRRNSDEEENDPYNYKAEYISRPKAFDESPYSSAYKEEKNPKKDYEYPYNYDSGYDHKEYERIKELSEKQAAEIKQNPGNCKEVKKDGMTCMTCKDPKTGGNYESCSYVTEPKNNKYAYSKERKFDSNDEPEDSDSVEKSEKSQKLQEDQKDAPSVKQYNDEEKPYSNYKNEDDNPGKYKAYYVHTSAPKPSEALREADNDENSEENKESIKPYDYKKALPGFYSDNEPKKDVEHVLAEFRKKDRSACKKVQKNGMTCFQCIDKNGLKHEECMFVSESAPKQSHLAYQEVKEFTSKPLTLEEGNEAAESQTVTTNAPALKSAAYVVANNDFGKKLKHKKAQPGVGVPDVVASVQNPLKSHKVKRNEGSQAELNAKIVDVTNIAPPEEFASADSKGAFWAETMPRYSGNLGVTLPEFMLSKSEHEILFDEVVAGA